MKESDLLALVLEKTEEVHGGKRLPCAAAFALAEERGCDLASIGRICDKHGIRIARCQLGCFA